MDRFELIEHCVKIFEAFNETKTTVDHFGDEYINAKRIQDQGDITFIHQVFYGCVRYKKMLKLFLNEFYDKNSAQSSRQDQHTYMVFVYLAVFRLEELGWDEFRKLVEDQPPLKMNVFIQFLFNKQCMNNVREHWLNLFDQTYVDDTLIKGLFKFGSLAEELIAKLDKKVTGRLAEKPSNVPSPKPTTIPTPFSLSIPKPKTKIEEVPPPTPKFKSRPFDPQAMEESRKKMEDKIKTKKEDNYRKLKEKYEYTRPFQFQTESRPTNKEKITKEVEAQRDAEIISGPKANPIPSKILNDPPSRPIKMTAAAILREEALWTKKMQEEQKYLQATEETLYSGTDYVERIEQQREEEERIKQFETEKRRLEYLLDAEEKRKVQEEMKKMKKETVKAMQQEQKELMEQISIAKQEEIEKTKIVVKELQNVREGAKVAKLEVVKQKRREAKKQIQESEEMLRRAEQEKAEERAKREDLIRQIRALEKVPNRAVKNATSYDPAETPKLGLFGEMSLAELKDRLEMLQKHEEEQLAQKREKILKEKEEKSQQLVDKALKIQQLRAIQFEKATTHREKLKSRTEERKIKEQEEKDKALVQLYEKLQEKKAARQQEQQRLLEERRQSAKKAAFLFENREALEEQRFLQKELGMEREIREQQKRAQEQARLDQERKEAENKATQAKVEKLAREEQERIKERHAEREAVKIIEKEKEKTRFAKRAEIRSKNPAIQKILQKEKEKEDRELENLKENLDIDVDITTLENNFEDVSLIAETPPKPEITLTTATPEPVPIQAPSNPITRRASYKKKQPTTTNSNDNTNDTTNNNNNNPIIPPPSSSSPTPTHPLSIPSEIPRTQSLSSDIGVSININGNNNTNDNNNNNSNSGINNSNNNHTAASKLKPPQSYQEKQAPSKTTNNNLQ